MKALFNKIFLLSAAALLLWSCEKEETRAVLKAGAAPTLAASKSTVVLAQAEENNTALDFTWNEVDYGFQDAIQYVLQIAKSGTGFAPATTTEVGVTKADLKQGFKVGELNKELNKILPTGVASQVEVRLKANTAGIVSNTVKLTVTPYKVLILYSYPQAINVAGNFQGWSPATAPQIVSVSNDKDYLGFIDFSAGTPSPEFKFVKGADWSAGDFGSAGTGKLGNGGGNLTLSSPGFYLIKANTNADKMTWESTKINGWGLIGDAIPATGWDSDRDLTYDAASKTYSITLDLVQGKVKFRANDDWAINLGDNGADGKPELGGSDIAIAAAGNYTITLDIMVGGNLSYTIKKN